MASFTDKSLQFNPYIQETPIQEMAQVGMQKQAQYDQGVQKIQNYIDRVSGVELYRPQDKVLLQSKLNELGSKLKTVAAGDFSNQQLVNSVAGMTGEIVKDTDIRNAISSTQQYKKAVAEREEYLKKGKTSPSNDLLLQLKTEKWLGGDIKETFSGGYEPYTNWRKNSLEILKQVTGDSTLTEDSFTTVIGKDGKPHAVLADAITRTKISGISPEKIKEALVAGLTPADWRQMEIDGLYTYHNVKDPNVFKENVYKEYSNKTEYFEKQKQILENTVDSTNSNVQKKLIQNKIEGLNATIKRLNNERNGILTMVNDGQLEKAKTNLYTFNAINNFAQPFSHTEVEVTKEDSPEANMAMRRAEKNQQWLIHKDAMAMQLRDILSKEEANRLKKKELEGYGGFAAPVDQSGLPQIGISRLTDDTNKELEKIKTSDDNFIKSQGKSQEWLDQQRAAWEQRPTGVSPVVAKYFNDTEAARRTAEANQDMLLDIRRKAEAQHGKIDDFIPKNTPVINYRKGNETYQYTAKDFVDLNSSYGRYMKVTPPSGPGGRVTTTYDFDLASKELSPKQFHLLQLRAGTIPAVGGEKVLLDNLNNYQKLVNRPYDDVLKKVNDTMDEELKTRISTTQAMGYNIPSISPAQKESLKSFLLSAAQAAEKSGGKLADSPDFDVTTAKIIASSDNPNFKIDVAEATEFQPQYYKVTAIGPKGATVSFRLNTEQKLLGFGTQFDDVYSQQLRPYLDQMTKTGGMTTAKDGSAKTTVSNAFLGNLDFRNVQNYGIKANIINLGGDNYTLAIKPYDPTTRSWAPDEIYYPSVGSMSKQGLTIALQNMTDSELFRLINERPATADDLQRLQKATKKPL